MFPQCHNVCKTTCSLVRLHRGSSAYSVPNQHLTHRHFVLTSITSTGCSPHRITSEQRKTSNAILSKLCISWLETRGNEQTKVASSWNYVSCGFYVYRVLEKSTSSRGCSLKIYKKYRKLAVGVSDKSSPKTIQLQAKQYACACT